MEVNDVDLGKISQKTVLELDNLNIIYINIKIYNQDEIFTF